MNELSIDNCPSLLRPGFSTYCPAALKQLFGGKKVSHILPYDAPWSSDEDMEKFMSNSKQLSISGVQEKYSLIQVKNQLRLTEQGEQGTHILKPIPTQLKRPQQLPANEHLTMQIASQVYNIQTAPSALIFFKNGEAAYITRRFDVKPDGSKLGKEDFATLLGRTADTAGTAFKYESSYEEMGLLIRKYVPAWKIETERFFALVVFNFLFSNGDAHLKNFALLETEQGDHIISPAYDLVNSRLHIDDSDFALKKGLFSDDYQSEAARQYGHAGREDFMELSRRLDMHPDRTTKIFSQFSVYQPRTGELIDRSYLSAEMKQYYLADYRKKLKALNT